MKKTLNQLFILLIISKLSFAQSVTFTPDGIKITNNATVGKVLMSDAQGNAAWQLNSNGSTPPFVTTPQRLGMTALNIGMEVFDTDFNALMIYDGSNWKAYSTKNTIATDLYSKVANDTQGTDQFGYSIAMNGDIAVIGSPRNDMLRGAAYVFKRINNVWTQQQKLTSSAMNTIEFGQNVAITDSLIAIKAKVAPSFINATIYIFKLTNTGWEQLGEITPNVAGELFDDSQRFGDVMKFSKLLGYYVLMMGSPSYNNFRGAVFEGIISINQNLALIYSKITPPDPAEGDSFGSGLAITPDQKLIVGSPNKNLANGKAYFFNRLPTNFWDSNPVQTITGANNQKLGNSISFDNSHLAIGSSGYSSNSGKIDFYDFDGSQWLTSQNSIISNGSNESLGYNIVIAGNYLISANSVSYKTYKLNGNTWSFKSDGLLKNININSAHAVGINSDGRFIVGVESNNVYKTSFGISDF
jgi:FG-GAP repeat